MVRTIKKYEVAVIGAGPAGMMAAIAASQNGAKVVLVEKNESAGKKLLLTGGGRCNLTNLEPDLRQLVGHYGKTGPFLFHAFSEFGPQKAIEFFSSLGVKTAVEEKQRVFPKGNQAQEVLEALIKCLQKLKVEILFAKKVEKIACGNNLIKEIIFEDGEKISAKNYIIAAGGKSYPGTGATGDGYGWARELGHSIDSLAPALVPLRVKESWPKELAGVDVKNAGINVMQGEKKVLKLAGDILFTHFGLSGPAILNASVQIGEFLKKGAVVLSIDLMPQVNREELDKKIIDEISKNPNRVLKNMLAVFMPQKLAAAVAMAAGVDSAKTVNDVTKEERRRLVFATKDVRLAIDGLLDIEAGMVTGGGVAVLEIDDKTMRSKIIKNLFFAGEIIAVHGETGGFNLQQCWATGHLAGVQACRGLKPIRIGATKAKLRSRKVIKK